MMKKKDITIQVLLFIFTLAFHEILNLTIHNPWAMGDEIGVLASAAKFSGFDWGWVLQAPSNYGTGVNYYGGGFGILLTPLFMLFKNRPYFLYQTILLSCAVLQSIPVLFAYRIMKYYLNITNRIYCIAISIAASFFVASRATNAVNESMLSFCMWLAVYLIVVLYSNHSTKKRGLYSVILAIVLGYSYTVHSRALIIIIVCILTIVVSRIIVRQKLVDLRLFLPSLCACYILASKFNEFIIDQVFLVSQSSAVHNTGASGASSIFDQLKSLISEGYFRAFFDVLFSNWLSLGLVTGFIFSVAVFLFLGRFYKISQKRIKKKAIDINEGLVLVVSTLVYGCTLGTFILFCFNWLESSQIALMNSEATRGYCYLRYMGSFYGAFTILFAYDIIKRKKLQLLIASLISVGIYIVAYIYCYFSIFSRVTNPDEQLDFFHFFAPFNLSKYGEYANGEKIMISLLVVVIIGAIFAIVISFKRYKIWAFLFAIFILYQYSYISLEFDRKNALELHSNISSMLQLLDNNASVEKQIDVLYFPLITGHWEMPYLAQFYFPEIKIMKEFPASEDAIMIVYRELSEDELQGQEFKYSVLSDGSYIYVKGDKYLNMFESLGISFEK